MEEYEEDGILEDGTEASSSLPSESYKGVGKL